MITPHVRTGCRGVLNTLPILATIGCLESMTAPAAFAQPAAGAAAGEGLQLAALHQAAVERDPRFAKLALQERRERLMLANLAAERRPVISAQGLAQYQSDVPSPPSLIPGSPPLFTAPKGTVDLFVRADQRLWDPTIAARAELERASFNEAQAAVRTALYALRQEVNDAFFAAALLQQRAGALDAAIADLESRLADTRARVAAGTALPAESAMVEATLLERRQDREQLQVDRAAASDRLGVLTGEPIVSDTPLALPDLAAAVASVLPAARTLRTRPEFQQFSRSRERLARQQEVALAQDRPRVSLFARGGVGRPGLNFVNDDFDTYGVAGIQLQWSAWNWGTSGRQREAYALDQQMIAADEAAFARTIGVAADVDRATLDRLQQTLALDDRIVALREEVARTAALRLSEGAITSADYLDRSTELLQARFARAGHEVELAQVRARLLTTLGREVQ